MGYRSEGKGKESEYHRIKHALRDSWMEGTSSRAPSVAPIIPWWHLRCWWVLFPVMWEDDNAGRAPTAFGIYHQNSHTRVGTWNFPQHFQLITVPEATY